MLERWNVRERSGGSYLTLLLSLGAAYFLSAKIGLLFAAFHPNVSPVWPGAGIALAALALGGKNLWPAIALGSLVADLTSGVSLFPAVGNASASTMEALVGAILLSRLFKFSPELRRRRDAFSLAAVAALAPLVGAAIGIAALVIGQAIPPSQIWSNYLLWWFGEAMGSFLFAPLIFVTFKSFSWTRRNTIEVAIGITLTGIVTLVSLIYLNDRFPFALILLTAILVVLRLRQMGAVTTSATICAVSIWAALNAAGNPATLSLFEAAVSLQIAAAVVGATGLLISSLLSERDTERIFLEGVLENLDAGVFACDAEGKLTLANRASRALRELPAETIQSQDWARHLDLYRADGVTPLQREEVPLFRALQGEHVRNAEIVMAPEGREPRTLVVNGHSLQGEQGDLLGAVVALHDVTELRKAERAALSRQTLHDSLTDLPNRLLLRDRLEHSLAARGDPCSVALLVLGLDGFKSVNDSLGHEAGDRVLTTIAQRLQSSVRVGDTVARIEGDQFAIILENMTKERTVAVASEIDANVREPVSVEDGSIVVPGSIGVTFNEQGDSAEELFRNAGLAMRAAKTEGTMQVFEPSMHEAVLERLSFDAELREAIDRQQFTLHYQPIVSLGTGSLAGFEALVRWNHPERGPISPANFIPLAETTGLIVPLGEWILRTACLQAHRWQEAHPAARHLSMHVNLSVRQLQSDSIIDVVSAALSDTELRADELVLEITESAVMHRSESQALLDRLHETGIHFAIDDFGTGYSSLDRLHSLPIDKVKIDKSFIDAVDEGSRAPLVAATIAMAHSLGLQTVAEGVERAEQLPFLRLHGCDEIQGYLFGRPTDAATIDGMLFDRNSDAPWTSLDPARKVLTSSQIKGSD